MGRPEEVAQLVNENLQPLDLGDLPAPLANQDVRVERLARLAHALVVVAGFRTGP